jgi:hypothetical protein
MTPLQKRAWWGLGIGLAFAISFVLVFVLMGGITSFEEDQTFRIIIDILWIGSLLANLVIINLVLRRPGMVDERDKLVLDRAPRIQWLAVVCTLVAWTIGLNEVYRDPNLMPTDFLFVIFMSVLIVSTLAQSLGILIGYRRISGHE